jgi:quercetin dioxygenase-like cupin family protein
MRPTARSPEELETLFEDAFVVRDREALAGLFEDGAVLVTGQANAPSRGGAEIARAAAAIWDGDHTYVAQPLHVLQARNTALVVAERGINVMRRDADGGWRYAISVLALEPTTTKEEAMQALEPVAVRSSEGEPRWWFGALAVIKATSADTGGQMTIVEMTEPAGAEAPLHVHHREDEAFWILEGSATFEVGDTTIEASAGDYLFGPRDIPHRYTVGASGCRMLFICTPGGFEELVKEMSEPAASRTLPPPPEEEPDMARIAAVAEANGCELLG